MHRLALKLQPYELSIEYKPGVKHYAADLLSVMYNAIGYTNINSSLHNGLVFLNEVFYS